MSWSDIDAPLNVHQIVKLILIRVSNKIQKERKKRLIPYIVFHSGATGFFQIKIFSFHSCITKMKKTSSKEVQVLFLRFNLLLNHWVIYYENISCKCTRMKKKLTGLFFKSIFNPVLVSTFIQFELR